MPFENHGSRSFTAISIQKNAPSASGVYGLSNAREWIYIAETDDIQAALQSHLHDRGPLTTHQPSGFTFELSGAAHRVGRRDRLVEELHPAANRSGA